MADLSNAAVISSCVTGNYMRDVLRHTASLVLTTNPPPKRTSKIDSKPKPVEPAVPDADAEGDRIASFSDDDIQSVHSDLSDKTNLMEERNEETNAAHHARDSADDFFRMLDGEDHTHDEENTILAYIKRQWSSKQQQVDAVRDAIDVNLQQWKVPRDEEIYITPQPEKLRAEWSKNATQTYDIKLPSSEAILRHRTDLAVWGFRRVFGPPINFVREQFRSLRKRVQKGPCQSQLCVEGDQYSLFGSALIGTQQPSVPPLLSLSHT